jgi:hypothetical protein
MPLILYMVYGVRGVRVSVPVRDTEQGLPDWAVVLAQRIPHPRSTIPNRGGTTNE